ncbi:MAG TPA: VWA domain-containing protein, partial [Campylobacterales bacterium]|nr:VWA domain-containing protein [Campylobacterales bacterium]
MSQFSFEYPWVLGLIVLFIVCAVFCKAKAKSLYFPHLNALMLGKRHQNYLLLILKWLGIMLAIVALASPVITKEYTNSKKEGRDIVLIVDTSDSMRERGFDPSNRQKNKFEVVKEVAASFVKKRQNDRVALITFADIAFVASPLTFETEFLQQIIGMQRLGIAGKRTAINDALVQSYSMLEKSKAKSKIIILLTDGVDNVSQVTTEELTSLVEKS